MDTMRRRRSQGGEGEEGGRGGSGDGVKELDKKPTSRSSDTQRS